MIKTKVTISNKLGLHARPSSKLAEVCNKFDAEIWIKDDRKKINVGTTDEEWEVLILVRG